ncbi:unnamed protein product [Arabidopsis lyrata]|nr:unnamed protein product [Arabidopsis lyrata]
MSTNFCSDDVFFSPSLFVSCDFREALSDFKTRNISFRLDNEPTSDFPNLQMEI